MLISYFNKIIIAECSQGQKKDGVQNGGKYICDKLKLKPDIIFDHELFYNLTKHYNNGYYELSKTLSQLNKDNNLSLLIGGDHSLGISSIDAFLNLYKDKLSVLWIDAHADINDHITSNSGNIHGMPLGYHHISRTDRPIWRPNQTRLKSSQLYYFGIRDLDDSEKELIEKDNIPFSVNTKHNYDKLLKFIDDSKYLLISFDVDSLDPELMSSTGTRSCCGLNCKDVYDVIKYSIDKQKLIHLDIMEFNPELGNVEKSIKSLIEIFQN